MSTTQATAEALRGEINTLLGSASIVKLRRIKARIEKARTAPSRPSACKPRGEPLKQWSPKHKTLADKALRLIQSGTGLKSAPYAIGPGGWSYKFFAADVAQCLVHDENGDVVNDERSAMAKSSITVSSLSARIVEEAKLLKKENAIRFDSANLEMQDSRQDPGWSKATTRGSGVVMNEAGKDLFILATERVANRVADRVAT